jgi:3-hydroxybutyryl-CoA dehydrogenase
MSDDALPTTAAVIGLGVMGAGIARLLLAHGIRVRVFDPQGAPDDLRVAASPTLQDAARDADIVFEVVPEVLELKHDLLSQISTVTPGIIASNTSTFVPSQLASAIVDPARLVVAHFFNPADLIPLVEVVPGPLTDPEVVHRTVALLEMLGKVPVRLERERTGFVANRLQAALLREAIALVEQGVASSAAVDSVVVNGIGPRWAVAGPLRISDLGGLDTWQRVCAQIFPTLDASPEPQALLREAVERGDLGAKTGRGVYPHTPESTAATFDTMARVFAVKSA